MTKASTKGKITAKIAQMARNLNFVAPELLDMHIAERAEDMAEEIDKLYYPNSPPADEPGAIGPALAPGSYGMPNIEQGVEMRSTERSQASLEELELTLSNLIGQKLDISLQLSKLNKHRFREEKATIFSKHERQEASVRWKKRKLEIQSERDAFTKQLFLAERQIAKVKGEVRAERARRDAKSRERKNQEGWIHTPSFQAIIDLLGEIRDEIKLMRLFPSVDIDTNTTTHDDSDLLEDPDNHEDL